MEHFYVKKLGNSANIFLQKKTQRVSALYCSISDTSTAHDLLHLTNYKNSWIYKKGLINQCLTDCLTDYRNFCHINKTIMFALDRFFWQEVPVSFIIRTKKQVTVLK